MLASDDLIRMLALKRVAELRDLWGDSVPESELAKGVIVSGEVVLLKGPQGIFKPRQLSDGPLTVMSTLASRYEDELLDGASTLNYDYAPPSREYENDGLKRLIANHTPVILLKQVKPKPRPEYMVVAPMYVDGFDDQRRQFALSTRADSVVRPASGGELGTARDSTSLWRDNSAYTAPSSLLSTRCADGVPRAMLGVRAANASATARRAHCAGCRGGRHCKCTKRSGAVQPASRCLRQRHRAN